jgi:hypothetical protein
MFYNRRRFGKYHAKKTYCTLGHLHDSMGEAGYCNDLSILKRSKKIKNFMIQIPYKMEVNGVLICKHIVDFLVENNDGTNEVHEFKGVRTASYNLKLKLFKALFHNVKYLIIKKER